MKTTETFDVQSIRKDFPILHQELNGRPLVYLDNAATTQKPQVVIDVLAAYYEGYNANIHRGIHTLAEKATYEYELTRKAVQNMIHAAEVETIIFTRGTTEGINLIASSLGGYLLGENDEVLISAMEHHSNIVPWQMICERTGAKLKIMPINEAGELLLSESIAMMNERTKIVSLVYVSNSLGTINPVREIITAAHEAGAYTVLDAAQAVSHLDIDVQELDTDFLVFSAHKLYGPTGIGVLYGKRALLERMPPYQGGGEMIKEVSFERTTYNELPYKFEAGTPNIADTIALRTAIEYLDSHDKATLVEWEKELLAHSTKRLQEIDGLRLIGTAANKVSVNSFVVEGVHHQDIGIMLDNYGIAVRTGHHCTQPLMHRLGLAGTSRASFSFYNTMEEVDVLVDMLKKVVGKLR